ncbi:hypothetical protein [Brevundimonas sp.]|uniref:hypothetical protein n=1 Tax=Brevundimonas sp. TaxID=1871086 RepID=UPI002ED999CE
MRYRRWLGGAAVIAMAVVAGVSSSQQQPVPPMAATQVDLPRDRVEAAALAQARQDPLATRSQAILRQQRQSAAVLQLAQSSPVPVLAPADPALLGGARLFTGDRHYMLVIERGEQIIEIYGATKAFQSAAPAPSAPPRTAAPVTRAAVRQPAGLGQALGAARQVGLTDIRTERTEYGVDVAFSRFGAAYNVSFICEAQAAPGCTEADAVSFAAGLVLIGGGA